MSLMIPIVLLVAGFILLIKGADIFVNGSSAVARKLKVPSLIIGLTIVALGTSAPELAVSTTAALHGSNEIALSNVLGSNIFNLLVVLGVCALIRPIKVDKQALKRDLPFSMLISILLFIVTCGGFVLSNFRINSSVEVNIGTLTRIAGALLLLFFAGYIFVLIRSAQKERSEEQKKERIIPLWKSILHIIIGIAMIILGGQLVVQNAKSIAEAAGMSETLIGLTIVAVGTSLPELVTSIVAARKGEVGLAVGNAVGSNIFNMLFILGVSSVINPIHVNLASLYDMIVLIVISLMTLFFSITNRKINRPEGAVMVISYAAYILFAAFR